ncbi:type I secretion C-terminal target domain-containing protein [Sphingobium algorifonticola]|nr:type I secretion C-terminal target domain-containing protein [Sphingobium algorifonticola]
MSDTVGAFEGAEGFGAATVGGRGGTVVHVTNLNDTGIGSLRWALESLSGPRIIVFDVGGTINLKSNILIQNGNVTIAGQTAPGEGITLAGAGVRIKADEVIMRGMHIRPGDGEGHKPDDRDALMIGTTDFVVNNVVIDHNSFTWAIDENVAINGKVQDVSFTNNIVGESLSRSLHSKGEHSKGLLISNWGGADDDAQRITVAKNLLTDNMQRNAEIRAGQDIEFINNYIHNYGLAHAGTAIGGGNSGTLTTSVDVIGNVWQPGVDTGNKTKAPVMLATMASDSLITLVDNVYLKTAVDANGNQNQNGIYYRHSGNATVRLADDDSSGLTILDSSDVRSHVLANVGAVNGSGRDAIDTRIVAEAASGTGRIINTVSEVYTAPAEKAQPVAATDSDRDGMADWYEDLYGHDKRVADDKGDADGDGYTNVEEYINGIIDGFDEKGARLSAKKVDLSKGEKLDVVALNTPQAVLGFLAGGGKVDLSAVVKSFDSSQNQLSDFVEIAHADGNSYVSVDHDGVGGTSIKTLVAVVQDSLISMTDVTVNPAKQAADAQVPVVEEDVALAVPPAYDPTIYVQGTSGNDTFTVRSELERIVETADGGAKDLVVSYVSHTLDAHVENLSMKDGAINGTGNGQDNQIVGNAANNILTGLDGNDRLFGGAGNDQIIGGTGNDWLEGGLGDDMFFGGTGADTLFGNGGKDFFCFTSGESGATVKAAEDRIVDLTAEDCVLIDNKLVEWADVTGVMMTRGNYATAFGLASSLIAKGEDKVAVHGARDSWLFWDSDGDHIIDSGVTMTNASSVLASLTTGAPVL